MMASKLYLFYSADTTPLLIQLASYPRLEVAVEAHWALAFLTAKEVETVGHMILQGLVQVWREEREGGR